MDRPVDSPDSLPALPDWARTLQGQGIEEMSFLSGALFATLQAVLERHGVPQALLRERLALEAAAACAGFSGRRERACELRDAVHLLRPGEHAGPGGEILQHWRQAVARPVAVALPRALPQVSADRIAFWLGAGQGGPVGQAAGVLHAVLTDAPRAETTALILADAALARALGWAHLLPLLAQGLKPRDLHKTGDALRLACYRAAVTSVTGAIVTAQDLARRAARLKAVVPKLRARGAAGAVEVFLARDALPPAALTGLMSDRAARRLCDRLCALGVLRELTGRDTFRLYGL